MQGVHEAGYVEAGEDSENFFVCARCYLGNLEALGYYVLVGYHDLWLVSPDSVPSCGYEERLNIPPSEVQ